MSERNQEVVRASIDAYNAEDSGRDADTPKRSAPRPIRTADLSLGRDGPREEKEAQKRLYKARFAATARWLVRAKKGPICVGLGH